MFEKIWLYDQRVARNELTAPIAELLTLEARLAWANLRQRITGTDQSTCTKASAT